MDDTQLTVNSEGDMDDVEDDLGLAESNDPDLHLELVQLKMERIKLQEEKLECKRMMLLNRAGKKPIPPSSKNRSILSDGRIVVRTVNDRPTEVDSESFGVGSGDALRLPALQRDASRECVSCGARAEAYCSRCAVTPYCSTACQKRDWSARHHAVCHNLARLGRPETTNPTPVSAVLGNVPMLQPTVPFRRPHSPASTVRRYPNNGEDSFDRHSVRIVPSTSAIHHNGQQFNTQNRVQDKGGRPQNNRSQDNKQNKRPQDARQNWQYNKTPNNRQQERIENRQEDKQMAPLRRPKMQREVVEEECSNDNTVVQASTSAKQPTNMSVATKAMSDTKPSCSQETNKIKPFSVEDVTPVRKIVPKACVIECLSVGDTVVVSVDKRASECRTQGPGYIGLSLHGKYEAEYLTLCDIYFADCERIEGKYTPVPGETFSYFNVEDGAWYRARCLSPTLAALIDSSVVVTIRPDDKTKPLPQKYADIPEFSCHIVIDDVEISDGLKCTLKRKIKDGYVVVMEHVGTCANLGEGQLKRWIPEVEYPTQTTSDIPRPEVHDKSRVFLVEATDLKRAFVRSSDVTSQRKYDSVLQGVVLYGRTATPLTEPPEKGQVVIAKYTDGLHYRVMCKRINVKLNKYLIEYIEFGNLEISKLEDLFPCPVEFDLASQPAEASQVTLSTSGLTVTTPAIEYIENLKDSATDLILTIPSGAKSAPSGVEVKLVEADTKVCVNQKLQELCTPEWKKLDRIGADVVTTPCIMYNEVAQIELPLDGCEIVVLDISSLEGATVSGYMKGEPLEKKILNELPILMEAYCNSDIGRQPYLPKLEEMCIAPCPPYSQWFRATLCEQVHGPGGTHVRLCYVDYGNMEVVPVTALRKMLPEFVEGIPALASHLEINDFPKQPTPEQLARAIRHMEIDENGKGRLKVAKCTRILQGYYKVDAPELIAAINV